MIARAEPSTTEVAPVKLLLVDDQEANLVALEAMLADLGHPIVTAHSAQETFRHLLQNEFALILLDVAMPGLNGLELASLLRERDQAGLTPIIFITAHYNDAESVARSYQAGGVDYLIKPVNPDILRAKVQAFVQLAQARRQLEVEIAERRRAEMSVQLLNAQLEQRVAQRTAELTWANEALLREIAERKQAEAELRRAKEELAGVNTLLEELVRKRTALLQEKTEQLNSFVYAIAHDLRAPLRAQHGFSRVLLEDFGNALGEEGKSHVNKIVGAAKRLDALVSDLLSYATISREMPNKTKVPLAELAERVLAVLAQQITESGALVNIVDLKGSVFGHEASLQLVLANLVSNALKFVGPGEIPKVRLWTEQRAGWVRLCVQDNGIGIAPEYHDRIFGLFQRLHRIDQYPGTGIGLALVRKGVERMGGRVGLKSEAGKGSCFWVELKAVKVEAEETITTSTGTAQVPGALAQKGAVPVNS